MFVMSPSVRLTRRRATYLVLGTWCFSVAMALPLFIVTKTKQAKEGDPWTCEEDWTYFHNAEQVQSFWNKRKRPIFQVQSSYNTAVLVLQYVVPQTVLIITYTFIGMKMWNSRVPNSSSTKKIISERHESVKKVSLGLFSMKMV